MRKAKIAALVPMRHHSERVPEKNYRLFHGKPLFFWIIETLLRCPSIDSVYINTDSPVIKEKARGIDPRVHIVKRPKRLCADDVPMNEILLYDVSLIEADYYLQTHSTNPLLKKETIEKAIHTFLAAQGYDSLFGVTRWQTRFWDHQGHPINHDPGQLERTQDLPPMFEENSNIYIFSKKGIEERNNRIGRKPLMFEISKHEAIDIDEEIDFKIAEALGGLRRTAKGKLE